MKIRRLWLVPILGLSLGFGTGATYSLLFDGHCAETVVSTPAGTYTGTFDGMIRDPGENESDHLVAFDYTICLSTGVQRPALSHASIELTNIHCLGEDATVNDLVDSCYIKNATTGAWDEVPCRVGMDPTTGVFGVKIDTTTSARCYSLRYVLDETALDPEYRLAVGGVDMGLKGGQIVETLLDICGPVCEDRPDDFDGCTPGYWRQQQHWGSWVPTGYTTGQSIGSVFIVPGGGPSNFNFANNTLLQAMGFGGGPSINDAGKILMRAAVPALLNAAHPDVDYPLTAAQVIAQVNTALATKNRGPILELAGLLDGYNNGGCPLGRNDPPVE